MNSIRTLSQQETTHLSEQIQTQITHALEAGQVIFLPDTPFTLNSNEKPFISETILDRKCKNISYDYTKNRLNGVADQTIAPQLHDTMRRYADYAHQLIRSLCPSYGPALQFGRTSYRPAEILNRKTSKRKDDTRLHVDAFPSTPVNGLRILRIFSNVNPNQHPRIWHIGEPFDAVLERFAPKIPAYRRLHALALKQIKATKTIRTPYDHYMLHLHDQMKLDDHYQTTVQKQRVEFPANSTWIVFTDHVSHAALSGQFLFEQTFYLPVKAMRNSALSPLKQIFLRQPNVLKQFAQDF